MTVNIPRNFLFCPPHACFSHTTARHGSTCASTCATDSHSTYLSAGFHLCAAVVIFFSVPFIGTFQPTPAPSDWLNVGAQRVERQWAEFKLLIRPPVPKGVGPLVVQLTPPGGARVCGGGKNKQSRRWAGLESMSSNQNPPFRLISISFKLMAFKLSSHLM